jgi:hypothetical protein
MGIKSACSAEMRWDMVMNLAEAIIAMSIRLLKGFMIVILLVIKAFLCVIKIGILIVGFIIKIFLSILKAGIPK